MEMKKTIVIEAQRIFRRKKHGMDFVALELIRELQKIDTHNSYIIAVGPGEDICLTETDNFKKIIKKTCYFTSTMVQYYGNMHTGYVASVVSRQRFRRFNRKISRRLTVPVEVKTKEENLCQSYP